MHGQVPGQFIVAVDHVHQHAYAHAVQVGAQGAFRAEADEAAHGSVLPDHHHQLLARLFHRLALSAGHGQGQQ